MRLAIRHKIAFLVALLIIAFLALTIVSVQGVYAYRGLARSISQRAAELPASMQLAQQVSDLRLIASLSRQLSEDIRGATNEEPLEVGLLRQQFDIKLTEVTNTVSEYEAQLESVEPADHSLGDFHREREKLAEIQTSLRLIQELRAPAGLPPNLHSQMLAEELEKLQQQSRELPGFLHARMSDFANSVRTQYRAWIVLTWASSGAAMLLLIALVSISWMWIFRPLRAVIRGSREVAAGDFEYRIRLNTHDEMAHLANALNDMTERFQTIRDDLDEQVRQRTKEVVFSERMASVGFLAAGVAHEINNPLASIALCAESVEDQLDTGFPAAPEADEIRRYLKMIGEEAFRCKGITERLLDFSRMGDIERHECDLTELVESVIGMVRHLGKYRQKEVHFQAPGPIIAEVSAQEFRQVVLNLVTNGLDSLDCGGRVLVELSRSAEYARLVVSDNGCGMTEHVKRHLFEPFFTRRRDGQGTGLGLAITYGIVRDHGGDITPHSDGPGTGSRLTVTLPLTQSNHEQRHRTAA